MTLVNYAYHTNVTDSKDWLSKLRTFAVAQGWNGSDYQTSVEWDAGTGWISGDGDFLQLHSTCYGNCDKAVYRFYAYNIDTDRDQLKNTAHTTSVYDNNTNPVGSGTYKGQDGWGAMDYFRGTSMPSSVHGIDKAWFFGNQYYIYAICQYDDYLLPTWHLGTLDLYPEHQSRTDCAFCGWSNFQGYDIDDYAWDVRNEDKWFPGLLCDGEEDTSVFDVVYFTGIGQCRAIEGTAYSYYLSWVGPQSRPGQEFGSWNFCKNTPRVTGYSAIRVGFKADFIAKNTGSGNMVPLGKTPFYVIPFAGLETGESITTDGKTYLCFPFGFTYMKIGYAFRIA